MIDRRIELENIQHENENNDLEKALKELWDYFEN